MIFCVKHKPKGGNIMKSRKPLYKRWYIWLLAVIIVSKILVPTDEEVIKDSQNNIDTTENTNESKLYT